MTSTTTRQRNRRGDGARLRADLVAAARSILEESGEDSAVTLRAVARRAGVAAPSIYAHFADRDAVLLEVVRESFEDLDARLEAAWESGGGSADRLLAICAAYTDFAVRHPHRYRLMFSRHGTGRQPAPVRTSATQAIGVLVDAVGACAADGSSASGNPESDAVALWAGLHGFAGLHSAVPGFPWPEGVLEELARRLARLR